MAADEVPPNGGTDGNRDARRRAPLAIRVESARDGSVLATVEPPSRVGTFSLVEGTANPTTFLVGAQAWRPTR